MAANTTLLTSIAAVIAAGPTGATNTAALVPAGKIMDYVGMLHSIRLGMKETLNKLVLVVSATDASDPNLTTLQNMVLTYS